MDTKAAPASPARPTGAARSYHSPLREEQAEETRARILEATGRVMATGIASLSIPAVAREAGVSRPTIYRHFRTKEELLAALYPYALRRTGLEELVPPSSIDELRDGARALFRQFDAFDDLDRAAMASPAAEEVRRLSMPRRLAFARQIADSIVPPLRPADRDRIARLLMVLLSSSALRTWRDYLGASVDEAANDVDWIVRGAIAAAREREAR